MHSSGPCEKLFIISSFSVILLQVIGLLAPLSSTAEELTYPQALLKVKDAAESVLGRTGTEGCLQGKLMNAMVALSNSCDAVSRKDKSCLLADNFIMAGVQPLSQMDDVAQQFLKLTASPK
jgi:hypothetical protein